MYYVYVAILSQWCLKNCKLVCVSYIGQNKWSKILLFVEDYLVLRPLTCHQCLLKCFFCFSGMFHGVIRPEEPYGVSLEEKILPEYLREMGYATHAIGKVRFTLIFVILMLSFLSYLRCFRSPCHRPNLLSFFLLVALGLFCQRIHTNVPRFWYILWILQWGWGLFLP